MDEMKLKGVFTEANLEFQGKILERSGLGDETGLSDGIAAMKDGEVRTSLRAALDESEMILYDVVEQLINKANIDPQEVSEFSPGSCTDKGMLKSFAGKGALHTSLQNAQVAAVLFELQQ